MLLRQKRPDCPGLQAFLETLDAAAPEIKRELDQSRNEVRIMTVHASKGLEAAVVFLVNSGSAASAGGRTPNLLSFEWQQEEDGWQGRFSFRPSKTHATAFTGNIVDNLKIRAEEEYRRLLYVGMTRAEDRLIVCGYRGTRQRIRNLAWSGGSRAGRVERAIPACGEGLWLPSAIASRSALLRRSMSLPRQPRAVQHHFLRRIDVRCRAKLVCQDRLRHRASPF